MYENFDAMVRQYENKIVIHFIRQSIESKAIGVSKRAVKVGLNFLRRNPLRHNPQIGLSWSWGDTRHALLCTGSFDCIGDHLLLLPRIQFHCIFKRAKTGTFKAHRIIWQTKWMPILTIESTNIWMNERIKRIYYFFLWIMVFYQRFENMIFDKIL